jgi:membrane protease YdiL (CAAX protease family)
VPEREEADGPRTAARVPWGAVAAYYALACAWSWPFFWVRDREPELWQRIPQVLGLGHKLIMIGPALAALVVRFWITREGLRGFSMCGTSVRRSLLFVAVPLVVGTVIGWDNREGISPQLFPWLLMLIGFPNMFGEEFGWRGWLQSALRPLPAWKAFLLIGILWRLWHFTNDFRGDDPRSMVARWAFLMGLTVALAFGIGWVYERTRSLVAAMMIHALADIFIEVGARAAAITIASTMPVWAYLLWTWPPPARDGPSGVAVSPV